MNIAFWILVILALCAVWLFLIKWFIPIGVIIKSYATILKEILKVKVDK